MAMANYSEYSNNNNYLPCPQGFHNEMAAAAFYPPTTQFWSGFTFTSPTQCCTLATHRPSIQSTSPITYLSAPGVGTSWQHSIPVTMPWVDTISQMSQPGAGTATVFTGVPEPSSLESQPSSSIPVRRPKRKALELPDDAPMSKVYLCADQFANMSISQTEQQKFCSPPTDSGSRVHFYPDSGKSKSDIEGWQRFREVESRLDVEVDEGIGVKQSTDVDAEGPRLKVAEGVLESSSGVGILPRKIVEDITKPCMQIVLWKSPGELIRDVCKDGKETMTSATTDSTTRILDSKYSTRNKSDMSRFPFTSRDNIMNTNSDMILDSMPNSSLQSQHSNGNCSLPKADFSSNSLPFSKTSFSSSNFGSARVNTSSTCGIVGDLDMFDSIDDEMQL